MIKKALPIVLASLMLIALLSACTPGAVTQTTSTTAPTSSTTQSPTATTETQKQPADYTGTVVYWQMNAGVERNAVYEQHVLDFNKIYPNVKIELSHFPASESLKKLELAAASDDMPNACDMALIQVPPFALKGAILPLDEYIENWDKKDEILPALLESQKKLFIDQKIYSLPLNAQLGIMWYRSDKFDAPQTWDEFYSTVEEFTDIENKTYGFSIRGVSGMQNAYSFMFAYSGITEFFTEDGKCTLNDPLHVEAMEKYYGMYKKYTPESDITNNFKEMTAVFGSGTAMMILHNTGSYVDHVKNLGIGNFAGTRMPKPINGNKRVDLNQGFGGYAMGKAKNQNYDSTFALMSYLVGFEAQNLRCQAIGIVPTNIKVFEQDWAKAMPVYGLVMDALTSPDTVLVSDPIYLPDYNKINADIGVIGFQNVMLGKTSVKAVLDDLASAFEKANDEYIAMTKK